jgi:CBS domain-containing protein
VVVGDLMEPPISIDAAEPEEAAEEIRQFLDGGPVPVVGKGGRLLGVIP